MGPSLDVSMLAGFQRAGHGPSKAPWGTKHVPRSVAPKNLARRIKEDRDGLIEELKSSLK